MTDYTLITAFFGKNVWIKLEPTVKQALKAAGKHHFEVAQGIWVFQSAEAAAQLRWLESVFLRRQVPFLSVPLSTPLSCGLAEATDRDLKAFGVATANLFSATTNEVA